MCHTATTTTSSSSSSSRTNNNYTNTNNTNNNNTKDKDENDDQTTVSSPPYLLRDHCRHLNLKTQTSNAHTHWYCDFTQHFVQNWKSVVATQQSKQHELVVDVVQEYCQPIPLSDLQSQWVGFTTVSPNKLQDPLPFRTMTIRLRPDVKQAVVLQSVHEAFAAVHKTHYHIAKSTQDVFQALGADGAVPFWLTAVVVSHRQTLERRLFLQCFHPTDISILKEEILQHVGGVSNQKAPLRNVLTPVNVLLAEACVLVQSIVQHDLVPSDPCPASTCEATTEWLRTTYTPSISCQTINSPSDDNDDIYKPRPTRLLFPSLAPEDYAVLQESYPLLERIFSELELRTCTYNTLLQESNRFGMRPCQPTLDKAYCVQLAQISQQCMLLELQEQVNKAEGILHDTLQDYTQLETWLLGILHSKYRIPSLQHSQQKNANQDIGQTPISFSKNNRQLEQFPFHTAAQQALQDVAETISVGCLQAYCPQTCLSMAHDSVHHVYTALSKQDDVDQQEFWNRRNRQAMIKMQQGQGRIQQVLERLQRAPDEWSGVEHLSRAVSYWKKRLQQAQDQNTIPKSLYLPNNKNNNNKNKVLPTMVPLLEFPTKLGRVCWTTHAWILETQPLFSLRTTTNIQVLDVRTVHLQSTPNHPLVKLVFVRDDNGQQVAGCHPVGNVMDMEALVHRVQLFKTLLK